MCRVALGTIKTQSFLYLYYIRVKERQIRELACFHTCYRGSVPFTLGLHDTHQVREQFGHAKQTAEHSEFPVSQGVEGGSAARHAAEHLR